MPEITLFQPLPLQLTFPTFKLFKPKNKRVGVVGRGRERKREEICDIAHKIHQQLFLAIPSKHI